jgi:hemin uptake protein HemP
MTKQIPAQPPNPATPTSGGSGCARGVTPLRYQLSELMRGGSAVEIEHQGQVYRLSLTRQGKLILTK